MGAAARIRLLAATGFTMQAHRLASITVTEALVRRYGPFGRKLRFTHLNAEFDRLGYHLQEITGQADAAIGGRIGRS